MRGALQDNGLRFEAQIRLVADGGSVTAGSDGALTVSDADSAWFVLAAGTDYADSYPGYRGDDPHRAVTAAVDAAAGQPYEQLRDAHIRDHRALFDRVGLDIGQQPTDQPTDQLLAGYTGGTAHGQGLGSTVLPVRPLPADRILASRFTAGQPPGRLEQLHHPPWSADYHTNINLQMNYWLAEVTNLAETTAPYDRYIEAMRAPAAGRPRRCSGPTDGWSTTRPTPTASPGSTTGPPPSGSPKPPPGSPSRCTSTTGSAAPPTISAPPHTR
ncbi:glycoside hydrolase N-terminal domain-containing protein [Streptomyces sp. M10(2022)]